MKKLILMLAGVMFAALNVRSQGCVIVRNISGFGQYNLTDNSFSISEWQLNINNRYFRAHRDFKGKVDQNTPKQNEAVVKSFMTDISLARMLQNGWSLNLSVPIAANSREASIEHGGANTKRHTTNSFGVGDIRFTVYKWILKPTVKQRGNLQLGLGLKLPTGDYKYQDYFYRNDSTKVLAAVNPSIQLGDGGTGIITELNTFYILNAARTLSLYGNFYYMANPREQNGTAITNGRVPPRIDSITNNIVLSVPDQFSIRGGATLNTKNWSFSGGVRYDGTPVNDLLGGSEGVRRAGYNFSIEPGVVYKIKGATIYTYVPIIVGRETKQTVSDLHKSDILNQYILTQGGFADYVIFVGILFKL